MQTFGAAQALAQFPSVEIEASQSVKADGHRGQMRYDAGKGIKGRKRHLLVDTLGLVLGVVVSPTDWTQRTGLQKVLDRVRDWFTPLGRLWVDGGCTGVALADSVNAHLPRIEVEAVNRSDNVRGLSVLPRRWVVERTFGWSMRQRRWVRDYERTFSTAEAWDHVTIIRSQSSRGA